MVQTLGSEEAAPVTPARIEMQGTDHTGRHKLPDSPAARRQTTVLAMIWLAVLSALAAFVALEHVRTHRGGGISGRARIVDIWRALDDALPIPTTVLIFLAIVVLVGCAWALWLALVASDRTGTGVPLRPPRWAISLLLPIAIVGVILALWSAPRDDVTAEALISQTGLDPTIIPTECVGFLAGAADLRSGDVAAGPTERAAASSCGAAIATAWPTRTAVRATGVAVWSTVVATGR